LQRDLELPPNFMVGDEEEPARRAIRGGKAGRPDPAEAIRHRQIYYAMVENLDDNMGRLADFLEAEGLAADTVVVFMADHGEMDGSHALYSKQWAFEASCGIPFIVAGPGVADGATVSAPTSTEDFFPTLLGLCGLTSRHRTPGHDASPLARGEADAIDRHGVMLQFVSELRPGQPFYASVYRGWRSERYKYVVSGDLHGMTPWQFFDLQADPHELENRLADPTLQDEIARHHAALHARMIETVDDGALAPAYGCEGLNLEWHPA
jgi:arylsulfatase A-like enzyme